MVRIFFDYFTELMVFIQNFLFVFATFPLAFCFASEDERATSYVHLVAINFVWIYVPTFLPFAMPYILESIFLDDDQHTQLHSGTEEEEEDAALFLSRCLKGNRHYFIWLIFFGTLLSSLYFPFRSIIYTHFNKNSMEKIKEGTFCLKPKYMLPRDWAHPIKLLTEWNLWAVIGFLFEALQHGYLTLPKDYIIQLLNSNDLENGMGMGESSSWFDFGAVATTSTNDLNPNGIAYSSNISTTDVSDRHGDMGMQRRKGRGTYEDFLAQTFTGFFWICFACAFTNILLVVLRLVFKGDLLHRYKQFGMVWYLVYYLNGPSFVTLVTAFLSALSCDYSDEDSDLVVLKADRSIECWKGDHIYMASAALWSIAFYLTQATLLPSGTYTETMVEGLDVLFVPVYMQYHYFLKAVFSFCYVFMESELFWGEEWIRILLLTAINFMILFIMTHSYSPGPCPIAWINTYRNSLFAMSVWSGVASLIYLYAQSLIQNDFGMNMDMSDFSSSIDLRYSIFNFNSNNYTDWGNGTGVWSNSSDHPCSEYLREKINISAAVGIATNSTILHEGKRFGMLTAGLALPFVLLLLGWCCSNLVPTVLVEVLVPVLVPVVVLMLLVLMAILRPGGVGHQLMLLLIMLAGWVAIFISAMLSRLSSKSANSVHYQIEEAFLELKFQLREDAAGKYVAVQPRVLEPLIALTLSKDDADIDLSMKYVPDMIKLTAHYNHRVQFQCAWGLANLSALGSEGAKENDIAGHGRALREAIADAGGLSVSYILIATHSSLTRGSFVPYSWLIRPYLHSFFLFAPLFDWLMLQQALFMLARRSEGWIKAWALAALANLCGSRACQERIMSKHSGVSFFVDILFNSRNNRDRWFAALAIANMASGGERYREHIRQCGGLPAVMGLLRSKVRDHLLLPPCCQDS
jgi:hypothetical protein